MTQESIEDLRKAVEAYLARKHAGLSEALAAADKRRGHPLRSVADAPPVQMLVPGFTVRQLPVDLTNINNVKYRPDGKLAYVTVQEPGHFAPLGREPGILVE